MKTILLITLFISSIAIAAEGELKITSFYRMDRNVQSMSTAHDVCFKVTPAPAAGKHYHATVTVDKGYRTEGVYETLVGPRGSACVVVSSFRGRVEVLVPELEKSAKKSL
jgi:hypothetical protein